MGGSKCVVAGTVMFYRVSNQTEYSEPIVASLVLHVEECNKIHFFFRYMYISERNYIIFKNA